MAAIARCLFCGGDRTSPNHTDWCDGRQGAREAAADAGAPLYPPANDTDTSQAAAASVADDTATVRATVWRFVRGRGTDGATCDDVEHALRLRHQTASARLWELHHKLHLITDSGRRRFTASGRRAIVYVAVGIAA